MLEWLVEKVDELLEYSLRIAVALEAIALSIGPAADDRRRLHAQAASDRTARELTAYVVHAIEGVEESISTAGVAVFDEVQASSLEPNPVNIRRTPTV